MAKIITHRVRNPKYDINNYMTNTQTEDRWLNIWSANVSSDGYTITPSDNWSISGDRITKIPVTKIENDGNIHNVTINTSITPNTLAKIDSDGNLVAGPTIKSNGENIKLLNEKGQWTKITGNSPIIFTISADSTDSTVSIISINHDTAQSHSIKLKLNNEEYNSNILTSNGYGHVATTSDINIPIATTSSAGLAPKINSSDANKMLQVNGNTVTWVNPTTAISTATGTSNGLIPKSGDGARKVLYTDASGSPVWTASGGSGQILKVSDDETNPTPSWVTPSIKKDTEDITQYIFTEYDQDWIDGEPPDNILYAENYQGILTINILSKHFMTDANLKYT